MAKFPLPFIPNQDYRYGGIRFGAKRDNGNRKHAACDLIAKPGTPVYAVEWGTVLEVPASAFFQNTYSVIVEHSSYIIRYAELDKKRGDGIYPGATVNEGQLIGTVGQNNKGGGMLHFEMYKKTATGPLSQKSNQTYLYVPEGNYGRRKDLIDPTPYLDTWKLWTQFGNWIEETF